MTTKELTTKREKLRREYNRISVKLAICKNPDQRKALYDRGLRMAAEIANLTAQI